MLLVEDLLLVKEIQSDIKANGSFTMYDSDSPYMFCTIASCSDETLNRLIDTLKVSNEEEDNIRLRVQETGLDSIVIVIKRYAKEEFINGTYFVSIKDVRGIYLDKDIFVG